MRDLVEIYFYSCAQGIFLFGYNCVEKLHEFYATESQLQFEASFRVIYDRCLVS